MGSSSSGGGGDGAGEGVSGGGNCNDPPTPPHADGDEGKFNQPRFNGGNNRASKVWVKGSNGKRYQVHLKEDTRRERLRHRTANTACCVKYEHWLGNLYPLWIEWLDVRVKIVTSDGQTVYPRFLFAKLIRQTQWAEKVQAAVAALCAAMERSGDVLDMAFLWKDLAPFLVSMVSPQHCSNLTKFTMEHTAIQTTALMYYYKFLLQPSAQFLERPKIAAEKKLSR